MARAEGQCRAITARMSSRTIVKRAVARSKEAKKRRCDDDGMKSNSGNVGVQGGLRHALLHNR